MNKTERLHPVLFNVHNEHFLYCQQYEHIRAVVQIVHSMSVCTSANLTV